MTYSTSRRLRILICAYACEPEAGSEPGVGWNTVCQIAQDHEVWVVTRANNREQIERSLARQPIPNVHFIYFDIPRWLRFWKKGQRGVRLYYYLWQLAAFFAVRRETHEIEFDVAHHSTFVTYLYPSFLSFSPVPFVWGPVGGGESAPSSFWKGFGWRGRFLETLRAAFKKRGEWDFLVRYTAQKAALAVATTPETANRLRSIGARSEIVIQSVAALNDVDLQALLAIPTRDSTPFRLFSVGRLLHWKGIHLGLEAFARLLARCPEAEYWLIGDGPERKRLERLAADLGVAHRITFHGALPRREVFQKMAACDVMLFPSLHDSGGWACVEAMAAGRPVVCFDLGGPALQVTAESGFKIPATNPAESIVKMADSLVELAQNSALRSRMAAACRARVRKDLNWSRVGEAFGAFYQSVIKSENIRAATVPSALAHNVIVRKESRKASVGREG